jgi:RHS repeat-associated protein
MIEGDISQTLSHSRSPRPRGLASRSHGAGSGSPPPQVLRTYYYDTNPLDSTGMFSQNAIGRLTAVQYAGQPGSVQLNEMYSYTTAGLAATKRLQANEPFSYQDSQGNHHNTNLTQNLDSIFTYNGLGAVATIAYPGTVSLNVTTPGPSYNYSFDSMERLSGMKTSGGATIVNNVTYNAANQFLTMTFGTTTETRGYNTLNQLTSINAQNTSGTIENLTYNYPTGTNNGKVSSMYNAVSGETVTYTYDSLNRLLTANGSGWGQQYGFDAFGNLLSKTVTSGSGPSLSQAVNTANNQIVGQSYDNNGNTLYATNAGLTYNLYYDVENHLSVVYYSPQGRTVAGYGYDAQNHRLWSWPGTLDSLNNTTNYTVNIYSPSGQKLGAYLLAPATVTSIQGQTTPYMQVTLSSSDAYFGSRRLAVMDQLGSNVWNSPSSSGTFFPWGEAKGSYNPQDTWNFATYWQDSASGLDYANNRYYSNAYGRFMTPDPYQASGGPNDPGSWNRYSYVGGDPLNYIDSNGLFRSPASEPQDDQGGEGGGPPPSGCVVNGVWTSPCPGVPTGNPGPQQPDKPNPTQRTCGPNLYLDAFGHCVSQEQCQQSAMQQLQNQKQLAYNAFVQGFGYGAAGNVIAQGLAGCVAGAFIGTIAGDLATGFLGGFLVTVPSCEAGAAGAIIAGLPQTALVGLLVAAAQYFSAINWAAEQFQQNWQNCYTSF